MMKTPILALSLLFMPMAVSAQEAPDLPLAFGNDYLKICENPTTDMSKGLCLGWFAGLYNGLQLGTWAFVGPEEAPDGYNPLEPYGVCIGEGVQNGQVMDIFVKYLKDHPEQRHYTSSSLFVTSLSEAFPCGDGE